MALNLPGHISTSLELIFSETYEWEPVLDEESGSIYYRNNASGDTQWEMPCDLDHLVISTLTLSLLTFYRVK